MTHDHVTIGVCPVTRTSLRSASRWQDFVLSIHWLLDNYPAEEQFLWDLAELAHDQVTVT